ncbi:MAG: ubiquitin-activating E1 FCCH domain-containing protein [Planctomycetota bacterium]|jgi:hypothetical protein
MAVLPDLNATQLEIMNQALDHIGQNSITAGQLTAESPKAARLMATHWDNVIVEVLEAHPWNFAKSHWPLEYELLYAEYTDDDIGTITGISQADPAVVDVTAHGYLTDYLVKIEAVTGMTEVNDRIFEITKVDADSFSLNEIDSQIYTAYASGGTCVRMEALSKYSEGYTYKVPSDCLLAFGIDGGGDFEIIGGGDATNDTRRLLTTVDDAVLIGISSRTTDTELTRRFITVLTARLAAEVAYSITGSMKLQRDMWSLYQYHLASSGVKDCRESNIKPSTKDSWLVDAGYE